ncbi:MAG: zinc ribbon domain-containing protein [Anaerolineales bacterium]|nr:zinc ribbon domain-containing protein [Anaerolineales bacterium]
MSEGIVCPNCRATNPAEYSFCQSCGTRLQGINPIPAEPSFQQPAQPERYAQPNLPVSGTIQIDHLGARLDGWADLVEDAGSSASVVSQHFAQELAAHQMPQVNVVRADLTPGGISGKHRAYQLTQSYTGATMAVYIGQFGKDLYLAWELFVRTVIKWRNILIMIGIAAVLSLLITLMGGDFNFIMWLMATAVWSIAIFIGAGFAGKIMRNSRLAFFIEEIDLFTSDDITAMMFVVHKSLMKALDAAGLDSSILREKEHYAAGRRERII